SFCKCLPFSSATLVDGDCDCLSIGPIKKRGNTCGKVLRPLKGLCGKPPIMRVRDDGGGNPSCFSAPKNPHRAENPPFSAFQMVQTPTLSVGNDLNLAPQGANQLPPNTYLRNPVLMKRRSARCSCKWCGLTPCWLPSSCRRSKLCRPRRSSCSTWMIT